MISSSYVKRNTLADSQSPYLQQHASNPVHWQEWSASALASAAAQNKPILLSIGYAACHWCHVMAHESFEDSATAAVMNQLYVNIKVDREERPDLDKIYQLAHQAMSRSGGGWPLTIFIDPHTQLPFFTGTYFPPAPRHGLPAFTEVITQVAAWYAREKTQLATQNIALQKFFENIDTLDSPPTDSTAQSSLEEAFEQIAQRADQQFGGFSGAPKFPHSSELMLVLRAGENAPPALQQWLSTSLTAMATRGLFDVLAGGFYRYCVDARWAIPHFEKMLYDNALLLRLYAEHAISTQNPTSLSTLRKTTDWMMSELRAPEGGFYSSLDADSLDAANHSTEGAFYVWQQSEAKRVLPEALHAIALDYFGLNLPANFLDHGEFWHLYQAYTTADLAARHAFALTQVESDIEAARRALLAYRNERPRPATDDKRLTAWNALAITGMVRAGIALQSTDLIAEAKTAFAMIESNLWQHGKLYASVRSQAAHRAYLDDHAYLLEASLSLMSVACEPKLLSFAIKLADILLDEFGHPQGGFYFTSNMHEALIHRSYGFQDDATPSGNAIAIMQLNKLGHLLGDSRYLNAAENALKAGLGAAAKSPQSHASLLLASLELAEPHQIQIVLAEHAEPDLQAQLNWLSTQQNSAVFLLDQRFSDHASLRTSVLQSAAASPTQSWLFRCEGVQCSAPEVFEPSRGS